MRYAQIRSMDISNGEGVGVSLFTQGCHFHCANCFNPETWNFDGGKEWTDEIKEKFFELIDKPYITRISILGGEPLAEENIRSMFLLLKEIREKFPDKVIWIYTGYLYEKIVDKKIDFLDLKELPTQGDKYRECIITEDYCDILVDGRYMVSLKDMSLKYCGSKNQRIIDVKKSVETGEIVLWRC